MYAIFVQNPNATFVPMFISYYIPLTNSSVCLQKHNSMFNFCCHLKRHDAQYLHQPRKANFLALPTFCGPGSVVGIVTGYGLDGPGIESRWG